MPNLRPCWCPHPDCIYKVQSQEKMCIGELPVPELHDETPNTHRLCLDTRETGHGIFDLQMNWSDCNNLIRIINFAFNRKP